MSHLRQQVDHVQRAIAYALWRAQDDGRPPIDLMTDSTWMSDVTGRFLALEVSSKRIPDVVVIPEQPRPPRRAVHARPLEPNS